MTDQPVAIDEVDKAIVRELQLDGRLPYAKLGPRVGLSQAAVRQRVQRLIENGVMQVVAVTDPLTLGFGLQAMVGVEVAGDLRAAAAKLAKVDEVAYVVVTTGRFDLLVEVVCRDNEELLTIVNDVIRGLPGVRTAETFTYLHLEKQTYSWVRADRRRQLPSSCQGAAATSISPTCSTAASMPWRSRSASRPA